MARRKRVAGDFTVPARNPTFDALASVSRSFKDWRPAREVLTAVRAVPTIFPQLDRATRVGGWPIERWATVHGPSGHGKAQPLDEPVLTADGWRPIGGLSVGDRVVGSDGHPVHVTGVYPQGVKDVYRVVFDDGGETRCCAEHLWWTTTMRELNRGRYERGPRPERARLTTGRVGPGSVKTTAQIAASLVDLHYVALPGVAHFRGEQLDAELQIDPYVFGLLLGDGCFSQSSTMFVSEDDELLDALREWGERVGDRVVDANYADRCRAVRISAGERGHRNGASYTRAALVELGLGGCRSDSKFVPDSYLHASPEARLELLRGLLDTDGSVSNEGQQAQFSTTSVQLRDAVLFLARSLGGRARWYVKETDTLDAYCVMLSFNGSLNPFRLGRKASRWRERETMLRRRIVAVERVGVASCVCISVDAPDRLYITRDFALTHNTACVHGLGLSFLQAGHFYAYVDAEFTTPEAWLEDLMHAQSRHPGFVALRPDTYEQTVDAVRDLVTKLAAAKARAANPKSAKGEPVLDPRTSALVVVDSIRKLVPEDFWTKIHKHGAQGDKGSVDGMGGRAAQIKAKMNADWLDELTPMLAKTGAAMVAIAREGEDVNADANAKKYGRDWKMGGGKALEYDASIVARITRACYVTETPASDSRVVGERHRVTIRKTKVAGKDDRDVVCYFHTSNGNIIPPGFDRARDVLEMAIGYGIVSESGAWYKWQGAKWQGMSAGVRRFTERPDALAELESQVRARFAPDEKLETEGEMVS